MQVRAVLDRGGDDFFVSAASAWEIATKFRIGKLPEASALASDIEAAIEDNGFLLLPISVGHGQVAGALPGPHKDTFDRILIAQAMVEDLILLSNETLYDVYPVKRLW
jgi:PIN domain nuclease of toxin-antitoxin system